VLAWKCGVEGRAQVIKLDIVQELLTFRST
jgi:hypothetical protein